MADKTVEIEVVTNTDLSSVEDLQTALEDTESSAEGLNETVESADGSNVNGVASDVDELGSSADDAANSVDGIQSSLDMLEASALMSISNDLSNLGSQAEDLAQSMNESAITVGQLATVTGIAEPEMRNLVSSISNATFPTDEAMMYIKNLRQMGVNASNYGKSATDIDKINDAFGLGAGRANSLATELSVLGVDMNNVSSSFNALAYANANTKGDMENFYTFLRKYDSELSSMGYNVDQASVMIVAATQKFGGGKAALSGLSQALKDSGGDARKLEEALDMESGALDRASQITGDYEGQLQQLADEEREHKTLLDELRAAWDKLQMNISPVLTPLASFMGIIGQAGSFAVQINGLIKLGNSIRKLSIVQGISGKLGGLRSAITGVGSAAKTALLNIGSFAKTLATSVYQAAINGAKALASLAKEVLIAGYNALKSAAMWVVQKAQVVASTIADYAAAAAQWALNVAMDANPIMLVVLAIVALIAVLGYLYFNNETVRNAINGLGQTFVWVGQIIYTSIVNAVNWVIGALQNLWNYVITLGGMLPANVSITGNNIVDTILRVMAFIATLPIQLGIIFVNAIAKVLGFGNNFVQNMVSAATRSVTNFANSISQLPGKLATELNNMLSAVGKWAATLPQKFWDAGVNAVKNFLSALGIASPGTMQRTLVWEISEMARRTPIEAKPLVENISTMGSDIVESFSNPLSLGFDGTGNARVIAGRGNDNQMIQENNFYFTDTVIDNDERMEAICDYITRRIAFNNTTAGRTV